MSDILKCPFCQQELNQDNPQSIECRNDDCKKSYFMYGSKELWQELIRTRKELEQSETCCTEWEKRALDYKAENIALSGELERTRKALDVAVDALNAGKTLADVAGFKMLVAGLEEALNKITALEQKDNGDNK